MSSIAVDSSAVKTHSLFHIADTFPYNLVPDIPIPLPHLGPLIPTAWESLLASHPDKLYTHTIVRYSARIGYTGPDQLILSANLPSANNSTDTLEKDILDQRSHNRLILVPDPKQLKRFISSPLGLVPKPSQINALRRIHHLSSPPSRSVNDYIPNEWGDNTPQQQREIAISKSRNIIRPKQKTNATNRPTTPP